MAHKAPAEAAGRPSDTCLAYGSSCLYCPAQNKEKSQQVPVSQRSIDSIVPALQNLPQPPVTCTPDEFIIDQGAKTATPTVRNSQPQQTGALPVTTALPPFRTVARSLYPQAGLLGRMLRLCAKLHRTGKCFPHNESFTISKGADTESGSQVTSPRSFLLAATLDELLSPAVDRLRCLCNAASRRTRGAPRRAGLLRVSKITNSQASHNGVRTDR